jgi:hypothetical protein
VAIDARATRLQLHVTYLLQGFDRELHLVVGAWGKDSRLWEEAAAKTEFKIIEHNHFCSTPTKFIEKQDSKAHLVPF